MKILVYDVAAEDGGGLFVLKKFYENVLQKSPDDIEWVFMTSFDILEESDNIKILKFKKVKKSWMHRLIFENFELPRIISEINPDLVISLQNMPVKRCGKRQFVYLHQSLQYCPKKFSFLKREERGTAIRQHIICGIFYKNALPEAEHIFVQTEWIKEATVKWLKWPEDRITVVPVSFDPASVPIKEYVGQESREFFYPARAEIYKNHGVVINACRKLVNQGINDFKVIFTTKAEDGFYASQLCEKAKGLPIEFIGAVDYEEIWDYYSKTILMFPSYLETCGIPMIEAKAAGGRIIASDMPFSHEALESYPNAEFFRYDDADELAAKMEKMLCGKEYVKLCKATAIANNGLMESMLQRI